MSEAPWLKSREYLAWRWYVALGGTATNWNKSFEYWLWQIHTLQGGTYTYWQAPAELWLQLILNQLTGGSLVGIRSAEWLARAIYNEITSSTATANMSLEYWLYLIAQSAGTPWWMASGVTPLAAWSAIGAPDLATSYINLVNPGTLDLVPGVAPTLGPGGWGFDGATQYLRTGIMLNTPYTVIIQYNLSLAVTIFGSFDSLFTGMFHLIQPAVVTCYWGNNGAVINAPAHLVGNYGLASYQPYRDGLPEPNPVPAGGGLSAIEAYIGALNVDSAPGQFSTGDVSSCAIFTSTLTDPQYLLQAAAMP